MYTLPEMWECPTTAFLITTALPYTFGEPIKLNLNGKSPLSIRGRYFRELRELREREATDNSDQNRIRQIFRYCFFLSATSEGVTLIPTEAIQIDPNVTINPSLTFGEYLELKV